MSVVVPPIVLTAGDVAAATGGRLAGGDAATRFESCSTDSRRVGAGQLFIALRGERFDGGRFVDASVEAGAAGVLIARGTPPPARNVAVIEVDDTLIALQELGRHMRRLSGASVIAVTGSAGKTTTKEAAAEFLSARYRVYRSAGNLNNHIGVPLSLLELGRRPEVAVVELGMNHAGEIRRLVELAEPDMRVWLNVGDAHAGHFRSIDEIADAKAEVLEGATAATRAVVNADDPRVMPRVGRFPGPVTTFGVSADAIVRATDVEERGTRGTAARMVTPWGESPFEVRIPGRGALMNVLAAAAIALAYGVPLAAIVARVAELRPAPRRGEVIRLAKGVVLIDDSYNASPTAVARALEALAAERGAARRIAVIGEIRELGEFAIALHEETGRRAAALGVDLLMTIGGEPARALADAARDAGLPAGAVRHWPDSDAAAEAIPGLLRPGDVVLVKGSRSTRTDVVADRVKAEWA